MKQERIEHKPFKNEMSSDLKLHEVCSAVETVARYASHEGLVRDADILEKDLDELCDELGTDDVGVRHAVCANDTLMPRVSAVLSEFCGSTDYDGANKECRDAERTFQLVRALEQREERHQEMKLTLDGTRTDGTRTDGTSQDNKSMDNKSMDNKCPDASK